MAHAVNLVRFSGATRTNASNAGAVFVTLKPFEERAKDPAQSAEAIQKALLGKFSTIKEALVLVVAPPPVRGIGSAGGFRMMVQDRSGNGPAALQDAVRAMMGRRRRTISCGRFSRCSKIRRRSSTSTSIASRRRCWA